MVAEQQHPSEPQLNFYQHLDLYAKSWKDEECIKFPWLGAYLLKPSLLANQILKGLQWLKDDAKRENKKAKFIETKVEDGQNMHRSLKQQDRKSKKREICDMCGIIQKKIFNHEKSCLALRVMTYLVKTNNDERVVGKELTAKILKARKCNYFSSITPARWQLTRQFVAS